MSTMARSAQPANSEIYWLAGGEQSRPRLVQHAPIAVRRFDVRRCVVVRAIRRQIESQPLKTEEYDFPAVYDGVRGMHFIYKAVESAEGGSKSVKM